MTTEQLILEIEKRVAWMTQRELQQQGMGLETQRRCMGDTARAVAKLRESLALPAVGAYTNFSDADGIWHGPYPAFD